MVIVCGVLQRVREGWNVEEFWTGSGEDSMSRSDGKCCPSTCGERCLRLTSSSQVTWISG